MISTVSRKLLFPGLVEQLVNDAVKRRLIDVLSRAVAAYAGERG